MCTTSSIRKPTPPSRPAAAPPDKSTRNLAEMLTQGSGMGVVDCVKAQKDYPNAAPGTKRLVQRLQDFQEDSRVKLEQFL